MDNASVSCPLKTPEKLWFSGVFRRYKMETLARKGLIRFEKSTNYRQTFGVKVVNLAWGVLQYRCRSMRKRAIDCIHSALYIVFGRKLIHEIEFVPDNVKPMFIKPVFIKQWLHLISKKWNMGSGVRS